MSDALPDANAQFNETLFDGDAFRERLRHSHNHVSLFREALAEAQETLDEHYRNNADISMLINGRGCLIDQVLRCAWERYDWGRTQDISLLAVGGYGRGELHPHSDVDLVIVTRDDNHQDFQKNISEFFTFLWDINLEISQAVRSIAQCRQEALKDITVATSLMESRTIVGPQALRDAMIEQTQSEDVWPTKLFFEAKRDEQIARHEKYYDIDYALEPNVKTSPGGLRDIQTIAWIAKRYYKADKLSDLLALGFLTSEEHEQLLEGEHLLWRLRYGLHMLAGRKEDRLLFDKQKELAVLFGYEDDDKSLAIEKLMQEYYRAVANLRGLNDALLQHFDEAILRANEDEVTTVINKRFQVRNDYIEIRHDEVFKHSPYALLEIFVLMAQNPDIKGVRAKTIRSIRKHAVLIDERFRKDLRNVTLFMELLRSAHELTAQLRRMSRYGVLGRYLPEFGAITGKMQHDLFHIYTVDAHTLQVIENMRRFQFPEAEEKFPIAAHIMRRLPKPELLYIAGLYHDIAKGRGGDHSTLGMVDATNFCRLHHLSAWDTKLVSWLIGKHLLMSMTAQRADIADPEVIHKFALEVGDKLHLDYLYALTVADISATNPTLWNSWRASLMRQLYLNTKRALRRGLEDPIDRADRIKDKQESVLQKLTERGIDAAVVEQIWANVDDEYFVRESTANITWHTEAIARKEGGGTLILIEEPTDSFSGGATQIFIYTLNRNHLFASSAAAMEKLGLSIQDARIFTSSKNYCMNTYTVLENDNQPVKASAQRHEQIIALLEEYLSEPTKHLKVTDKRIGRKLNHFRKYIETELINSPDRPYSTLEISCRDQPGILASIGRIFAEHNIQLLNARIATLGERVEDLFFIVDANNKKITDPEAIKALLDDIKEEFGS